MNHAYGICLSLLILSGCGGGSSTAPVVAPASAPVASTAVTWARQPDVNGAIGNNGALVILNSGKPELFVSGPATDANDGRMFRLVGTMQSLGQPQMALDVKQQYPTATQDYYIRSMGVVKGAQMYYALLYTGPCYGAGCVGGFTPSWATSPDGVVWTWYGSVSPFGRNQSSANALVLDESRTDGYRFMAWLDVPGYKVRMMHSADGLTWAGYDQEQYPVADLPNDAPLSASVAKTPYGCHMVVAIDFPATAHRHLFSATCLAPWKVLEMQAETYWLDAVHATTAPKGTRLAYEPATNLVHAFTQYAHLTMIAKAY